MRQAIDPTPPTSRSSPSPNVDTNARTEYVDTKDIFKSMVVGVLVAVEGELEGEIYKLNDGENKIGRTDDCDVQLPSRHISRPHAILIHKDGMFAVKPLKPESPVYVNGERIEDVAQIRGGDFLKLGRTTLRLLSVA